MKKGIGEARQAADKGRAEDRKEVLQHVTDSEEGVLSECELLLKIQPPTPTVWCTPINPAAWEAETGRFQVLTQPGQLIK